MKTLVLSVFVVVMRKAWKLGVLYFLIAFAAGWCFGPIRQLVVAPIVGPTMAVLFESPFMLIINFLSAYWIVNRWNITVRNDRLVMGGTALAVLLLAEIFFSITLLHVSFRDVLKGYQTPSGAVSIALFCAFALMPALIVPNRSLSRMLRL